MSEQENLINRAIAMHLLREGQFSVAASFLSEISDQKTMDAEMDVTSSEFSPSSSSSTNLLNEVPSNEIRKQFASMYYILQELKEKNNLHPAIEWSRENREALEARGSNLEFELCRLQFVWVFHGESHDQNIRDRQAAINYARQEFQGFLPRYPQQVQQLMGAMAYCSNLKDSPYASIFNNASAWDDVAQFFTREFCSLLGLSADSPLYVAATAGAIALPTLLKLQTIMKSKRTEWTSENELPVCFLVPPTPNMITDSSTPQVEVSLPPSYLFHSIFVCPVSKEQATDDNPPMMMPCGHVIAEESLRRLSKGNRFKCPYCPSESHPRDARKIFL